MSGFPKFLTVLGRMCIGVIFVLSGIHGFLNFQDTVAHFTGMLSDWQTYAAQHDSIVEFAAMLVSWATGIVVVALLFELIGGLLLFFGIKVRLGAVILILFLIPVTIVYNHFWFSDGAKRHLQMGMFLKNLAIFGGLLYVLALGKRKAAKQVPYGGGAEPKKK